MDEYESCPFCGIDFVCDAEQIYDTKDEGEAIEKVGVEKNIFFPKFVITETGDNNVHEEFSGVYIFYKQDILHMATRKNVN